MVSVGVLSASKNNLPPSCRPRSNRERVDHFWGSCVRAPGALGGGDIGEDNVLMSNIAEGRPRWPKMAPRWLQGGLLGPLRRLLGASWGPLGVSWGPLGRLLRASWGHSGASGGVVFSNAKILYVRTCLRCVLEPSWGRLGAVSGPSWGHLGAILGPSWGHLGAILGHLGPS